MTDAVSRDVVAQRIGQTLEASEVGRQPVALTVDRVEDYPTAQGERFSVFLHGPADQPLRQGTHQVHGAGGLHFEVFLVPVRRDGDRLEYEAAFARIDDAPSG